LLQLLGVPLQLAQIMERIGAVQRLIEKCVLAVQNRFLQGALDDVVMLSIGAPGCRRKSVSFGQ